MTIEVTEEELEIILQGLYVADNEACSGDLWVKKYWELYEKLAEYRE